MFSFSGFLNRSGSLFAVAILAVAVLQPAYAGSADDTAEQLAEVRAQLASGVVHSAQLDALEHTLADALSSHHFGLETSALRLLITYADRIAISRATVHDVVRLYRDHENEQVRRMAVVALAEINDRWANDFMQRSESFERSEAVLSTLRAVRQARS